LRERGGEREKEKKKFRGEEQEFFVFLFFLSFLENCFTQAPPTRPPGAPSQPRTASRTCPPRGARPCSSRQGRPRPFLFFRDISLVCFIFENRKSGLFYFRSFSPLSFAQKLKKRKRENSHLTLVRQGPHDDVHVQVGPADHVAPRRGSRLPDKRVELRRQPPSGRLLEVPAGDQEVIASVRRLCGRQQRRRCPVPPSLERPGRVQQRRGARLDLVQPRAVVDGQEVFAP